MTKVLMIVSAADHWTLNDGTLHPTGFWAEELVTPYSIFTDAGWDVDVATPGGKAPVVDKASLDESAGDPDTLAAVKAKLDELAPVLAEPLNLADVKAADYDLVFYPGGHGPMEDLAVDETSGHILTERMADNAPVALLCHAPAAVLATENAPDGSPFAGRKMTGFSNDEERAAGSPTRRRGCLRAASSPSALSTRRRRSRGRPTSSSTATSTPGRTRPRPRSSRSAW